MIIDFHTHTFPEKIAGSTLEKLSAASHTRPFTNGTAQGLTASMAEAGVDLSIVLPVATAPRQVEHINDSAATVSAQVEETGLLSFGCMHPDFPGWREELTRIHSLGLKGIKLHPVYQGVDFDDPRYLRILDRAGELGLIVVTHAGLDVGFPGMVKCSPEMIRRAVEQVGPVKLVLAHMGGWRCWDQVLEQLSGLPVSIDTSFSIGKMTPADNYYREEDLNLLDERAFVKLVRAFGARRVLFGSDSPWSSQKDSLSWIRGCGLTEEETSAILGRNGEALLRGRCGK
ncbi:metal-dependent hydrolase [Acutalibacter sp. 1XD8-33]|uniref:amidohydrolase family protein n=1 Tax=Acutalibacter sp. 1XD8-33 TaxID=2320081 RepID=UPI000EA20B79|nr:amidohydrolase family protein [Acutalibacter sp. 1XD8-33]RKJ39918.1 metal-dependent hydrolase [Acutalibacter sp. 1XD8-33]